MALAVVASFDVLPPSPLSHIRQSSSMPDFNATHALWLPHSQSYILRVFDVVIKEEETE